MSSCTFIIQHGTEKSFASHLLAQYLTGQPCVLLRSLLMCIPLLRAIEINHLKKAPVPSDPENLSSCPSRMMAVIINLLPLNLGRWPAVFPYISYMYMVDFSAKISVRADFLKFFYDSHLSCISSFRCCLILRTQNQIEPTRLSVYIWSILSEIILYVRIF